MGARRLAGLGLALAIAAAGCRSQPAPTTTTAPPPAPEPAAEAEPAAPVPAAAREGWIDRSTLERVLDQGVGAFLGRVRVEAVLASGQFVGWRVLRHDNEWVDVLPGDILLSVNDMPLETPAQVQALWDSLRKAPAITATVRRGGETFEIRFRIGEPPAPDADAGAAP